MQEIYGVFGAGGYGREVMPLARMQLQKQENAVDRLFFVVDNPETVSDLCDCRQQREIFIEKSDTRLRNTGLDSCG